MKKKPPPDRIYLQLNRQESGGDTTWCQDKIHDDDVTYERVKKWPDDRKEELKMLIDLLSDCYGLNSSSHVIERMQRIVIAAKSLKGHDLNSGRKNFEQFLIAEANGE